MSYLSLAGSWLAVTSTEFHNRAREHFSDAQLYSGGALIAALLVLSIIKKIILLAILIIVIAGVAIAYQSGAFDSILDNIQNKKTT